ncbi:MAG TPA: substrate-binding domain-containing protein [bacterium]|mgnify:CR=1 FL=1|nr:substrate-binding domain-containing protein [bacterium]HPP12203.1 substrate-binding domain-containing protein [bacterium]
MVELKLKIDKHSPEPLYHQVRKALETEIAQLSLSQEKRLPPSSWIASQLGVSTLTVDLAMEELVSKGVLYRRPRLGTFIRVQRPHDLLTLGLIASQKWYNPDLHACEEASLLFSDYVRGIRDEISLLGCKFKFLAVTQSHRGRFWQQHNGREAPGGFIIFEYTFPDVLAEIRKAKLPYLVLNPLFQETLEENVVRADDEGGIYQGVAHLLNCGYPRVIFCAGDGEDERSIRKLSGYRKALAERNLPYNLSLVLNRCPVSESGPSVVAVVRKVGVPCGVMVVNDVRCHLVCESLLQARYKIPEEVGLVSFDDTVVAGCHAPALTAVNKPRYQMGRKAVEILVGLISGQLKPPVKVVLQTALVVRESTRVLQREHRRVVSKKE